MLRITRTEEAPHQIVLKLEGRLIEPWVDLLAETCWQCRPEGRRLPPLVVDLGDVTFASKSGLKLLHRLQGEGVACVAWSPFLKTLAQHHS